MTESQPRTHLLCLSPPTPGAIAPFGALLTAPDEAGQSRVYTQWLGSARAGMTPRLHVNHVRMSLLPLTIRKLERHPYSAQIFMPLDVAQFLVVLAPQDASGFPDLASVVAFLLPGNVGIVYRPGVWHAGITVLERAGSFNVLMWRNDSDDDEEFLELACPILIEP